MGIHLIAVMSPGPDFTVVVKNALQYSRKQGLYTAFGIGLGLLIHLTYCISGLALVVQKFPLVFTFTQITGAGYLFYLAYQSLQASRGSHNWGMETESANIIAPRTGIKEGFWTNLLNAKATLFLLSVYTQVFSDQWPLQRILFLSLFIVVSSVGWFSFVAVTVGTGRVKRFLQNYSAGFNLSMAALLAFFSLRILWQVFHA